ncbi:cupin domain-containing protein [Subtercola sp. Z020]|uniref:cupin domain-containing protein n=1 Tax=Subtercola sp. Z020 TaxID=2080582 RepID=UPI000CE79123|nr:cupin domain-containing protein [Subtercola sp. Z020]PPF85595.1 cupin domain-containing protein [Subtercola sp. Z020]
MSTEPHTPKKALTKDPDVQRAVWFLGALLTERLGGPDTDDSLAVLQHEGERGYGSPMHVHLRDDETFVVLDGRIELTSADVVSSAEAGSALFLPRGVTHGFVVSSATAKFLTLQTPSGFDKFVLEAGTPATADRGEAALHAPTDAPMPSPEELTRIAARYGIEIVGPPPTIRSA